MHKSTKQIQQAGLAINHDGATGAGMAALKLEI
jgi:hypothetical protein